MSRDAAMWGRKAKLTEFVPVESYGKIERPLRNIRFAMDEHLLLADLVPCAESLSASDPRAHESWHVPYENGTQQRFIVEGNRALRLTIHSPRGLILFPELHENFVFDSTRADETRPRIHGNEVWPLLLVVNSPWRRALPIADGGDIDTIQHYRIYSMTMAVDLLGTIERGEWVENNPIWPQTLPYEDGESIE